VFAVVLLAACDRGPAPPVPMPPTPAPWIERDAVARLAVELAPGALALLEENPRAYVRCTVTDEDGTRFEDVALKLRGQEGSFRALADKPAFTLNFDKLRRGRRFHDHDKLYLGNAVQDETYAREHVAALICAGAGIPTPRVAHARVALDGRDLGLFVVKEGFGPTFLARHFPDPTGNLYDDAVRQDLDGELEKDGGSGPDDASDVAELLAICADPDPAPRWAKLPERLDIDAFLRFAAFEAMAAHWDGYCWNRNNYRLYFDPRRGVAQFLPFAMDQVFGDPEFPVLEHPPAIVAAAVMPNPAWRTRYRTELTRLLPGFAPERLVPELQRVRERLLPHLRELALADSHLAQLRHLEHVITTRYAFLVRAVNDPDPAPLAFDDAGFTGLRDWRPIDGSTGLLERRSDGGLILAATADAPCRAAWRCTTYLTPGRYRLTATCTTRGVVAHAPSDGATLRVAGASGPPALVGDHDAQGIACEATVLEPLRRVDWVIELVARAGRVEVAPDVRLERRGP